MQMLTSQIENTRVALLVLMGTIVCIGAGTKATAGDGTDDSGPIAVAAVDRDEPVQFQREVLPILQRNCLACHNETDAEADLVLETPTTIRQGGDSGPAVIPGNSTDSLLFAVSAHRTDPIMPPEDNGVEAKNLSPEELGLLKLWIDQGAEGKVSQGGAVQLTLPPSTLRPVYAVAVTPQGDYVAAGRASRIDLYHVPTKRQVGSLSDPALADKQDSPPGPAHIDLVQSLAASADGRTLASGGYRTVKLWRKQPPQVQREFEILSRTSPADKTGKAARPKFITSRDGRRLASIDDRGAARIYDVETGVAVGQLTEQHGPFEEIKFSPDATRLLTRSDDGTVRVWNIDDGSELARFDLTSSPATVSFLADGNRVACGMVDGTIHIVRSSAAASPAQELPGHAAAITSLVGLSTDSHLLASASRDKTMRIWNVDSGEMIRQIDVGVPMIQLAATRDGQTIAAVGENGVARLYRVSDGQPLFNLQTNALQRREIEVAQRKFAVAEKVRSWAEYDRNEEQATLRRAEQKVKSLARALEKLIEQGKSATDPEYRKAVDRLAFRSEDLKQLAAAVVAAEKVIDQRKAELEVTKSAHQQTKELAAASSAPIQAVEFSADGMHVAVVDRRGRVQTFATSDGSPIDSFENDQQVFDTVAMLPDGRLLTHAGHHIQVWQLGSWSLQRTIGTADTPETLVDRVTALAFSPDGKLLATGGGEASRRGELKLWDVATGKLVREIPSAHSDTILGLEFSSDGVLLASCGTDRNMRVFDVASGERMRSFEYHTSHVLGVSWRADSRVLATCGADNVVRVWNYKTGTEHKNIKRFNDKEVTGIQFLGTDGDFVVSAADRSVSRWDYNGGGGKRYESVASFMYSLDASADGATIAAGGHDGTVHVWNRDGKSLAKFE